MAKDPKYNKKIKNELISQAYDIIVEDVEIDSNNYAVQKWYALILDARSSHEGIQTKIEQLENVKRHMDVRFYTQINDK